MPSTPEPAPAPRADLPAAPDHGLGVTLNGDGADFAVHAPHATAVDLCLLTMDADGAVVEETRIGMHGPSRGLWSAHDAPWPRSRSGLVVQRPAKNPVLGLLIMAFAGLFIVILVFLSDGNLSPDEFPGMSLAARTHVLDSEGQVVWLAGMSRRGISRSCMERRSAAELDRIWSWAVARGYTWETDTYVNPECLRAE